MPCGIVIFVIHTHRREREREREEKEGGREEMEKKGKKGKQCGVSNEACATTGRAHRVASRVCANGAAAFPFSEYARTRALVCFRTA
jgi:hypothetical protein